MRMHKIVGGAAAVVLAAGLWAGPAEAATATSGKATVSQQSGADRASADRKKRRTHVGLGLARNAQGTYNIQARLTRGGRAYASKVLILQTKHGSKWVKVRHTAARTDANGFINLTGCITGGNPKTRVHFAGDRKSQESNSRSFHAGC